MNQILFHDQENETKEERKKADPTKKKSILHIYTIQFYIASILLLSFLIFFFVIRFQNRQKENYSQVLLDKYHVSTLYANSSSSQNTSTLILEDSVTTSPFVIGIIQIDSIKLNYPLLSESNNDLLEISPCRFAGPMPNEVGNLCIAGHNYADNRFFGRLDELEKEDVVKIFDLTGHMEEYFVRSISRISSTDTRCTNQDTNGEKMVTLLTCNNLSTTRLAVQCIQK